MNNFAVIDLINTLLGKGNELKNSEVAYHCPFCNHYKRKLQINISSQYWQCWVCGQKGRKIISLFKKISAKKQHFEKLANLLGDRYEPSVLKNYSDDVSLPIEYTPLYKANRKSPEYKNAIH